MIYLGFDKMLSELMLPENPDIYKTLIINLTDKKDISKILDYRILELQNNSGEKTNLFIDTKGNNHFSRYIQNPKEFGATDEIKEPDSLFDMTLNDLQSMQEIVKNFLTLKEQICQQNPNTKLQIIENVVISESNGKEPTYYILDGNNWEVAQSREFIPQNIQLGKDVSGKNSKQTPLQIESLDVSGISKNYLEPLTRNPFKKFIQEIKRRFQRSEPTVAIANNQSQKTDTLMSDPAKEFNDRIHFVQKNASVPSQIPTSKQEADKQIIKDNNEELTK